MADAAPSEAKTSIDSLVELLHSRGRMELHQIAAVLNIDPLIVEGWAKVLEGGNLAKIVNEVGKMYVEPITVTKEQEKAVKAAADTERTTIMSETAAELGALDRFSVQLDAIAATELSAEKLFKEKIPALEAQLKRINKIYQTLEQEDAKIESVRKKTEAANERINKKVTELYSRIETIDPSSEDLTRGELAKMRSALKAASEYENQINLIAISKDKAMEAIKKSMEVQIKALEKEMYKAQRSVDMQMKQYSDQIKTSMEIIRDQQRGMRNPARQVEEFRRAQEEAKKTLLDARSQFNDEYARTMSRMKTSHSLLSGEIKSMILELDQLKENYGQVSKIYDSLQKTKNDVTATQKKLSELRGEASKLIGEMNALENANMSVEAKVAAVASAKKRAKAFEAASMDTKETIRKLSERAEDID